MHKGKRQAAAYGWRHKSRQASSDGDHLGEDTEVSGQRDVDGVGGHRDFSGEGAGVEADLRVMEGVFAAVAVEKKEESLFGEAVTSEVARHNLALLNVAFYDEVAVFDELVVMDQKGAEPKGEDIGKVNLPGGQAECQIGGDANAAPDGCGRQCGNDQ